MHHLGANGDWEGLGHAGRSMPLIDSASLLLTDIAEAWRRLFGIRATAAAAAGFVGLPGKGTARKVEGGQRYECAHLVRA